MIYVLMIINFLIFVILGTFVNEWLGLIVYLILNTILFILSIANCIKNYRNNQNNNNIVETGYTTAFEDLLRDIKEPIKVTDDDMIEFSIIRHFMD